jgi:hypothetical protein
MLEGYILANIESGMEDEVRDRLRSFTKAKARKNLGVYVDGVDLTYGMYHAVIHVVAPHYVAYRKFFHTRVREIEGLVSDIALVVVNPKSKIELNKTNKLLKC